MQFRHYFAESFGLETWIALAVFLLVAGAMAAAVLLSRRRRRQGRGSSQRDKNTRVELTYLAVVAVVAVFLATASLIFNNQETAAADGPKPALAVRVTGFQWCWRFRYLGQPVTVTGQCEGGSLPTLMLPADRAVRIEVTSTDVIHGFWIPYLRWKIYAYPGHVNSFTVTLRHDGRWIGRCSELCGLYHYEMDFYVQVVPPARFDRWLHARGGSATAVSGT